MTASWPYKFLLYSLLVGSVGGLLSCSQQSNGTISKGYHNLTAHFNAYVMARDDIDEVERYLFKNRKDNYNEPLPILLLLDSNATQGVRAQLDDAIKKASLVAERHQNSKWLDNAYILVGKTRLYRQDLPNAIEVFKYVNTKGTNDDDKHEALIYLMRAYTETGDFANGLTVAEYLRTQPLNKTNTRDFYLTKANLHQKKGEDLIAAGILDATFSMLPKSEATARLHLITGQLYEAGGKPALATPHFAVVLKSRPNYDQEFFANIYLMQAEGTDSKQQARNAERFEAMLADRKNSDLKDKIYFTMARTDARRGNYDRALVNYNKAVQVGITNTDQVPLTYAEMGTIYFEQKRNYSKAQAYYDSALALLPQNNTLYAKLAGRKKSLDEFVANQTVIQREDSLQRLAQMNPAALDKLLDKVLDQQAKDDAAQLALAQKVTGRASVAGAQATNSDLAPADRWVLYNPVQMAQGLQEFNQTWGNRPLSDNWRRLNKDASVAVAAEASPLNGANPANATNPDPQLGATGNRPAVASTLNQRKAQKDELYRQIPFSTEALQKSNDQLESALYRQGKVYKFQLDQPVQAMTVLDQLLTRFPNSSYRPEAYYLMHLSAQQLSKPSPWRERLLTEFPTSSYAKLASADGQPTVAETGSTSATQGGPVNEVAANQSYVALYALFQAGNSTEALARTEAAIGTYGGSKIADKFALLRIILLGRVQNVEAYRQALGDFVRDYPTSLLLPHVKERQAAAEQLTAKRK